MISSAISDLFFPVGFVIDSDLPDRSDTSTSPGHSADLGPRSPLTNAGGVHNASSIAAERTGDSGARHISAHVGDVLRGYADLSSAPRSQSERERNTLDTKIWTHLRTEPQGALRRFIDKRINRKWTQGQQETPRSLQSDSDHACWTPRSGRIDSPRPLLIRSERTEPSIGMRIHGRASLNDSPKLSHSDLARNHGHLADKQIDTPESSQSSPEHDVLDVPLLPENTDMHEDSPRLSHSCLDGQAEQTMFRRQKDGPHCVRSGPETGSLEVLLDEIPRQSNLMPSKFRSETIPKYGSLDELMDTAPRSAQITSAAFGHCSGLLSGSGSFPHELIDGRDTECSPTTSASFHQKFGPRSGSLDEVMDEVPLLSEETAKCRVAKSALDMYDNESSRVQDRDMSSLSTSGHLGICEERIPGFAKTCMSGYVHKNNHFAGCSAAALFFSTRRAEKSSNAASDDKCKAKSSHRAKRLVSGREVRNLFDDFNQGTQLSAIKDHLVGRTMSSTCDRFSEGAPLSSKGCAEGQQRHQHDSHCESREVGTDEEAPARHIKKRKRHPHESMSQGAAEYVKNRQADIPLLASTVTVDKKRFKM